MNGEPHMMVLFNHAEEDDDCIVLKLSRPLFAEVRALARILDLPVDRVVWEALESGLAEEATMPPPEGQDSVAAESRETILRPRRREHSVFVLRLGEARNRWLREESAESMSSEESILGSAFMAGLDILETEEASMEDTRVELLVDGDTALAHSDTIR